MLEAATDVEHGPTAMRVVAGDGPAIGSGKGKAYPHCHSRPPSPTLFFGMSKKSGYAETKQCFF